MHTISPCQQQPLQTDAQMRVKTLIKLEKCIEPQILEKIACTSLCQLSDNICTDDATDRRKMPLLPHYDYHNSSPWKLKKEHISLQSELAKISKNIKPKNHGNLVKYNSIITSPKGKENIDARQPKYSKTESQTQKHPSIFMRLRAAKDAKTQLCKKDKSQTEIITIMKKRRHPNKQELQSKKIVLAEQIEDHTHNLRLFSKKIEDLQFMKKHSLNSIKQIPYCMIELEGDNADREVSTTKSAKVAIDHWKTRRMSVRRKKPTNANQPREAKSIDRRENKQNILATKKASLSLQRGFKEEYQSSNPLTRLLYEKYINTISIHTSKEESFHFL